MTTKLLVTMSLTLTALLMSGCAGKVRYPDYYTLAIAPTQKPALNDAARQSASVAVRLFDTPAYLRQGRIVYRQTPTRSVSTTITAGLPIQALWSRRG